MTREEIFAMHAAKNRAAAMQRRRDEIAVEYARQFGEALPARRCVRCRHEKPHTEFSSYVIADKRYWHRTCTHCRAARYIRSKTCLDKRRLIASFLSKPCADCGHRFHHCAMRFVRHGGSTSRPYRPFSLASAWSGRSMEAIRTEAKANKSVCHNCLDIRDFRYRDRRRPASSKLAELPPELREQVQGPSITVDLRQLGSLGA